MVQFGGFSGQARCGARFQRARMARWKRAPQRHLRPNHASRCKLAHSDDNRNKTEKKKSAVLVLAKRQ
jgi:hypothetical protein